MKIESFPPLPDGRTEDFCVSFLSRIGPHNHNYFGVLSVKEPYQSILNLHFGFFFYLVYSLGKI